MRGEAARSSGRNRNRESAPIGRMNAKQAKTKELHRKHYIALDNWIA